MIGWLLGRFRACASASAQTSCRTVWRMSREHPMGVYVDASAPLPRPAMPAREPALTWYTSSYDLQDGLQVQESTLDGLADDRFADGFSAGR